jgi:hypothetical protein
MRERAWSPATGDGWGFSRTVGASCLRKARGPLCCRSHPCASSIKPSRMETKRAVLRLSARCLVPLAQVQSAPLREGQRGRDGQRLLVEHVNPRPARGATRTLHDPASSRATAPISRRPAASKLAGRTDDLAEARPRCPCGGSHTASKSSGCGSRRAILLANHVPTASENTISVFPAA